MTWYLIFFWDEVQKGVRLVIGYSSGRFGRFFFTENGKANSSDAAPLFDAVGGIEATETMWIVPLKGLKIEIGHLMPFDTLVLEDPCRCSGFLSWYELIYYDVLWFIDISSFLEPFFLTFASNSKGSRFT